MTDDWEKTLRIKPGTLEWYEEVDRRFLESAFYAHGENGEPFGRFLKPDLVVGKQVLEIGCGWGPMLVGHGAHLAAIDRTTFAVRSTHTRIGLKSLQAQVLPAGRENLSFRDGSFDVVWTWGVIHHSRSTEPCIGQIARVLRPGGHLMMMVYYRPSLVYYLHCGLVRGVLMGRLLRQSLDQIYVDSTDGYCARVFNGVELKKLLSKEFHTVRMSIVGLKAELYPIPRNRFKIALETLTPELANAILRRFRSMIVIEATRS